MSSSACFYRDKMSNQQMNDLLLQSLSNTAGQCHPDCVRANNAQEDYGNLANLESTEIFFASL